MGVVYAGEDTRLGRPVALKFVPEELADARAFSRLRVEARAASALNHPNICTIYDIGEHQGRPYLVMELLKGHTLREVLAAGPLKFSQTVDIGIQVADALDAAHGHGILHRDIKPANLFLLERGAVKILDFGLAKHLLEEHVAEPSRTVGPMTIATDPITGEGVTVGTVSYMSPEQVTGEQLDGRTDLFSLGIVLYECVTGHRPFTGKTSALILSAILNESPPAPVIFNPHLPLRLQDVINGCLEKDRELRYQDAAGLRADLKRVRRDLESGHSQVVKVGSISNVDRGVTRKSGSARRDAGVAPRLPSKALAWGAALVTVATLATSYWFWPISFSPSPPVASTTGVSSPDTGELTLVGLATSSLEARRYRDALNYAQDVLRVAPDNREAQRVLDEAGRAIARFDGAIARGQRAIASNDPDGASEALRVARDLDPSAGAVATLSEQIVSHYKTRASVRPKPDPAVAQPVASAMRPPQPPPAAPPKPSPEPAPAPPELPKPSPPQVPERTVSAPAAPAPNPIDTPPTLPAKPVEPPAASRAAAPPTVEPAVPRPSENDDALITRLIESWARAIESKDLAAYRALKPNMTASEQRRIEEGFRTVASQRVAVTILGIDQRGQQALVRLRRRDTIMVNGREQIQESQQSLTVVRSAASWVIRDIGR
jgi:serine/threonine protein kinase